jgi:hypothetical protein
MNELRKRCAWAEVSVSCFLSIYAILVISLVIIVTVVLCSVLTGHKEGLVDSTFVLKYCKFSTFLLSKEVLVFYGLKLLLKLCFRFILVLYLDYVKYIALPSHDHLMSSMFCLRNSCQYWKRHESDWTFIVHTLLIMCLWIDINWNTQFIHEFM